MCIFSLKSSLSTSALLIDLHSTKFPGNFIVIPLSPSVPPSSFPPSKPCLIAQLVSWVCRKWELIGQRKTSRHELNISFLGTNQKTLNIKGGHLAHWAKNGTGNMNMAHHVRRRLAQSSPSDRATNYGVTDKFVASYLCASACVIKNV